MQKVDYNNFYAFNFIDSSSIHDIYKRHGCILFRKHKFVLTICITRIYIYLIIYKSSSCHMIRLKRKGILKIIFVPNDTTNGSIISLGYRAHGAILVGVRSFNVYSNLSRMSIYIYICLSSQKNSLNTEMRKTVNDTQLGLFDINIFIATCGKKLQ